MGFFDQIFGHPKPPRTIYDEFMEIASPIVVNGYRRIAAVRGCAPGPNVSDADIIAVYRKVGSAFQQGGRSRKEILPAEVLNNIVFFFLQKFQMMGNTNSSFFDEHVAYEADKYQREGLRSEYKAELSLLEEPALWHARILPELQFSDAALVQQLDELRLDAELSDEAFFMLLMQTRNMTRRSVILTYRNAKRSMPNFREIDYLAVTIADRATKKIMALPFNSSPKAWTEEQLRQMVDEAESLAETCKDLNGVCHMAIQIEEYEGNFDDPFAIIARLDELFTDYGKRAADLNPHA